MPVKAVIFDHNGETIRAQLVYEPDGTLNEVTVILSDPIEGVERTILFVQENETWITASDINKLHPGTTQKIIDCLKSSFICKQGSDHILCIYDLLS